MHSCMARHVGSPVPTHPRNPTLVTQRTMAGLGRWFLSAAVAALLLLAVVASPATDQCEQIRKRTVAGAEVHPPGPWAAGPVHSW